MHMKHIYKFAIVTAVYNTAEYLDEMIESVINQDIDFEKNVQLILVDDGSKDNSVSICEKYKTIYPDNIELICLNHNGVSATRNKGIELAKGEYVNFLDSDDKLESNALSEVWKFFKKHENEIDLVAIPLYFFEAEQGNHILNYKFSRNELVNINERYNYIQLSASSTFIKRKYLNDYNIKFNKNLKYAEDAEFISEIIINKKYYGVLNKTKYLYRRRYNETSTIQKGTQDIDWFLYYIKNYSIFMINKYKNEDAVVSKYIQYLIMYDLQWRINKITLLSKEQKRTFYILLKNVLINIDFKIIIEQKNLTIKSMVTCLIVKYFYREVNWRV
ncbi:glycosyltransferase [Clostridium botulinum]|nr:glycosyltransferase [Clostridium botulinum]